MSRWDYDTVFYRVFCITLLGVALTFTVILTNVFVDIDGILTNKKVSDEPATVSTVTPSFRNPHSKDDSEDFYEDKDYQDSNDLYRSKRSLGAQDLLLQIKDPTVKKILTNRLTTLLDELDEEESNNSKNEKISNENKVKITKTKIDDTEDSNEYMNIHYITSANDKDKEKFTKDADNNESNVLTNKAENKDDILHLAMHNIILQGIIGNMKMENVYKKVHDLVMNFEKHKIESQNEDKLKETKHTKKAQNSQELKLLDEIINCEDLQKQIVTESTKKTNNDNLRMNEDSKVNTKHKDPNVIIKTIIDITGPNDKANSESILNSKANLNGIVKLVYNGKSIRFRRVDEPTVPVTSDSLTSQITEPPQTKNIEITPKDDDSEISFKKMIQNYLKKISKYSSEHDKVYTRKRLKRHIKIRYENTKTTPKPKHKNEDDELFVEIETHFNSHGSKGEKKKKIIRDLIDKIKHAIHSDPVKRKPKHLHVKNRTQNRLDGAFANNVVIPVQNINHRHIDPISKLAETHEKGPIMSDDLLKSQGPGFLVKKINSAELSTVDTEYDKVNPNGIPQRLQIPLNNDLSDETQSGTNVMDLGNIKFLVKDIEGSGFSIGFNQFQGESPDPESIKLFTGLENVIQTYHQKYDQEVTGSPKSDNNDERYDNNDRNYYNDRNPNYDRINDGADRYAENIDNFDSNIERIDRNNDNIDTNNDNVDTNTNNEYNDPQKHEHLISRRSISTHNQSHHHINEYDIFKKDFLPYDNYDDITNKGDQTNAKKTSDPVLVIDENIFDKDLKPAEIFTIANLFARRKRSVKVKKISNVNTKKKLNRYINTKSMATKSIFQNNKKRTKRQIDKIRIVARDSMGPHVDSGEDIFVMSDEKIYADRAVFADRAVISELVPEHNEKVPVIEHYDIIAPQKIDDNHFDILQEPKNEEFEINPYVFQGQKDQSPYTRTARLTSLMSKYPHIIMEEASKEETFIPYRRQGDDVESTTATIDSNLRELSDLIPQDKANYKVTVKIRPKNTTTHGFKEVHTSINKSYNKNGILYTSLVNVSEVSKVEKLHKNSTRRVDRENFKEQQDILRSLINQHKTRIEEQLKHLNSEKQKLEEIVVENVETDEILNLGDINKSTTTEKIIDNTTTIIEVPKTTITTTSTTTKPTTKITTTEKIVETTQDPVKIKLLNKLDRNEHLTSEILKKIDKNTGILETFLDKILSKLNPVTEAVTTQKMETNTPSKTPVMYHNKNTNNHTYEVPYYSYQPAYNSNIYQKQIQPNKNRQNMTNNNYFEHDNLKNEVEKEPFFKPKPGEMVINNYILKNNTRFYLDPLGDDFASKMVPLGIKSHMYNTPYSITNATMI